MRVIVSVIMRMRIMVVAMGMRLWRGRSVLQRVERRFRRRGKSRGEERRFCGELSAVLEFGREEALLALTPAELAADRAPGGLDRVLPPRPFGAFDHHFADAERPRLVEQDRLRVFRRRPSATGR